MESDIVYANLNNLYSRAFPASRTGPLYNAFSYPTKISPEAIAVFIASHTNPGDKVLDAFAGSGTTGLAVHLCARPTEEVIRLAAELAAPVVWGPRKAVLYELSTLGSFVSSVLNNPPNPIEFAKAAAELLKQCEAKLSLIYEAFDSQGNTGVLRHCIWSDLLLCGNCGEEVSFWEAAVRLGPLEISSTFVCSNCGNDELTGKAERVYETVYDPLLNKEVTQRKRELRRVYGQTGNKKWSRAPIEADNNLVQNVEALPIPSSLPVQLIAWGDLYRRGYHKGISHVHHFYTRRNLIALSTLWGAVDDQPEHVRDALKLLILSYNASHSTLMTRVVVKKKQKDFVLTGAQSGVLYVSNLPVEKNVFEGVKRKVQNLAKAFATVYESGSEVEVVNASSTQLHIAKGDIDYVFTDPPFGDYIPYAELNFLNEAWLGNMTQQDEEIIISSNQNKTVDTYGNLLKAVFLEIHRVLKADGKATVVFHSAKAEVWGALQTAYSEAGLVVERSSVLDKIQGSFKQVSSNTSVKGDPLLLLEKSENKRSIVKTNEDDTSVLLSQLWSEARTSLDEKEITPERLYSRLVTRYLERGRAVPMDAASFYPMAQKYIDVNNAS